MKYYLIVSLLISFFISFLETSWSKNDALKKYMLAIRLIIWFFYFSVGGFSIIHALLTMKKQGMVQEKMKMVLTRHISYLLIVTICNLYVFVNRMC